MRFRPWVRGHGVAVLMTLLPVSCPLETLAESSAEPDSSMARESAESVLNGRRLFFTPQQRLEATADLNSVAAHSTEFDKPEGKPASDEGGAPADRDSTSLHSAGSARSATSDITGVYFDGFVSGPRGTRLLVNGLPCQVRASSLKRAGPMESGVDCPAVSRSRPRLSLALVSGRLQVSRGKSVMGLLRPGQGL